MNFEVVIPLIGLMIVLYLRRVGSLAWFAYWWVGSYVLLRHGFATIIPVSVIAIYMMVVTASLLVYFSATDEKIQSVVNPLVTFLADPKWTKPMIVVIILIPLVVALQVRRNLTKAAAAPVFGRTIHPAPPDTITFKGKKINLITGRNPYRNLEVEDPEAFATHVKDGRRVYYQNCVFCHGDTLHGDGIYAKALDPLPANFADPGTIAMLQEAFLFWRIAKGGPGLPDESGPWGSAMPAFENFLGEDEIWNVILFLYDFTGQRPRAEADHHAGSSSVVMPQGTIVAEDGSQ